MRIKAITLWEPWATLMAHGLKQIETRAWPTKYRGPLAIHAAKRWHDDQEYILSQRAYAEALAGLGIYSRADFHLGCVLAVVDLTGCWQSEALKPRLLAAGKRTELAFGNYAPQRFGFYCENVRKLPTPLAVPGAQQLWWWEVPDGLAKKLGLLQG